MIEGLWGGFSQAVSPANLLVCLLGCIVGTVVGVLPGLGPVGAMSLLLPFTFVLTPTGAIIMMAGIFYGGMYGGSTTSILLRLPGEAASVVTCIDGHEMAKNGRAGTALAAAAIGSWVAGTLGVVGLMLFATVLGKVALAFGPIEYFAVAVLGVIILSNVTGSSPARAFLMVLLGILLSYVGLDSITGLYRFTLGNLQLGEGFDIVALIMGLFGVAEVFSFFDNPASNPYVTPVGFREMYPTREEFGRIIPPSLRGSLVGFFMGLIPGPATVISSFAAYQLERKVSRHPEQFGKGAIEGVAGPEAANNAATAGTMVPLLALGIPFAPATAILLSSFMIHGVTPGPMFIARNPDMFWTVIASMYIGNIILVVLNLPLVGVFASILKVRAQILMPLVLLLCIIGAYGLNGKVFDIWVMLIFGLIGYVLRKFNFDPAPIVVGFILGNILEMSFRQSMILAGGNLIEIVNRPISGGILGLALVISLYMVGSTIHKKMSRHRFEGGEHEGNSAGLR